MSLEFKEALHLKDLLVIKSVYCSAVIFRKGNEYVLTRNNIQDMQQVSYNGAIEIINQYLKKFKVKHVCCCIWVTRVKMSNEFSLNVDLQSISIFPKMG